MVDSGAVISYVEGLKPSPSREMLIGRALHETIAFIAESSKRFNISTELRRERSSTTT